MIGRRVLLAAAASFACLHGAMAAEPAKLRLVFSSPPTSYALPHFVAQDLGWLKQAGLEVEEIWLTGSANALRSLLAGEAQLAAPLLDSVLPAIIQGGRLKHIGSWQPITDYQLVAHERIKSMKDAAGTRIAGVQAGTLLNSVPRLILQKHGVDTSRNVDIGIGGHEARLQAVLAGKADITLLNMITTAFGKRQGGINLLASVPAELPGLGYMSLIAKTEDLANAQKRQAFATYVRHGVIAGARFVMDQPEQAAQVLHKRMPNFDPALLRELVLELNKAKVWGVNGGVDDSVAQYSAQFALDYKTVDRLVRVDEIYDRTIVDGLLREMGTR